MPDSQPDDNADNDVPEASAAHQIASQLTSHTSGVESASEPVTEEPAEADMVQMALAAPWRFDEFKTPAVPGYKLTPMWTSYPADIARELYDEAVRVGFAVSTSAGFNEGETA